MLSPQTEFYGGAIAGLCLPNPAPNGGHAYSAQRTRQPQASADGKLSLREAIKEEPSKFPQIHVVRDYPVLLQIGELRHRQYVESQRKPYPSMALAKNCLIEPADFSAVNIFARDQSGITSAMRIGTLLDDANPNRALLERVANEMHLPLDKSLTCTRLVRAPLHSGRHAVSLVRFVRWQTVRAGWRYCIMQTAKPLVPFFEKFEFVQTGIWTHDSAAGLLQVLVLDTNLKPRFGEEND